MDHRGWTVPTKFYQRLTTKFGQNDRQWNQQQRNDVRSADRKMTDQTDHVVVHYILCGSSRKFRRIVAVNHNICNDNENILNEEIKTENYY